MLKHTRSTCPYCGVGCGVVIESQGQHITGVRGDPEHPANWGRLCTKGSTLALTASPHIQQQTRLLQPQMRTQRQGSTQAISWEQALDLASHKLLDVVQRHGPDALGFYVSGQLLTEDYYVFNKLAKGLLGTNNIDTNSRLCMSSAVAGYKLTLGADAPPACYEDVDHAQCLFIVGSNTAWAHPILFRRIEEAKAARPDLKMVVADPRRTETAGLADLFLPLQPGTDVALFHGLLHIMLWEGWTQPDFIAQHTSGFEALKTLVRDFTPDKVADICGLRKEDVFTAAQWFATSPATLSLYCQGLNQSTSGTAKNAALINLHLATGQIGKPGAGPFSLTGQPNAMGGREVGGMANLLSAHRDLANPKHRAEVAALWGVGHVPEQPGKTAVDMFEAAADGQIKALWIACTNPAQSMPHQSTVRRALERAEWVVVQEAFASTATCAYADLLLPATTWGEKEGTVTNSERRISRVRAAIEPPGQARHDWHIAVQLAQRLEQHLRPGQPSLFQYSSAESVWLEHRESTRGRDLDITGLSYELLEQQGPQQWPFASGSTQGTARLYQDGVFPTPDGRARFAAMPYVAVAEKREPKYPFSLNTGRLRDHWHGMSRTGVLGRLFGHVPEPVIQMHPQDMARRNFKEGSLVRVSSKRGSLVVPVQASAELGLSQTFMAMHWGSEYLSGQDAQGMPLGGVNALTSPEVCPSSHQPELKHAAIKVEAIDLPWSLMAMAWLPSSSVWQVQSQLRPLMSRFDFASCVPFGRERTGLMLRVGNAQAADAVLIDEIEQALGLASSTALRYVDPQRGQRRCAQLDTSLDSNSSMLQGFLLAGDTQSATWMSTMLTQQIPAQVPAQTFRRQLLMPGGSPPAAMPESMHLASQQICNCLDVSASAIKEHLVSCKGSPQDRLTSLQQQLGCGTQCGSCVPEIKRLISISP